MGVLREDLAQEIVDCAMELGNNLTEDKDCVEGEIEKIVKNHVVKLQIYPVEDIDKKVITKKKGMAAARSNPWLMASFWNYRFEAIFDRPYVKSISGKELGMMKRLLAEYDAESLRNMIKWFLDNYGQLSGYKGGPTIEGFTGWRRSIASLVLDSCKNDAVDKDKEYLNDLGVSI